MRHRITYIEYIRSRIDYIYIDVIPPNRGGTGWSVYNSSSGELIIVTD